MHSWSWGGKDFSFLFLHPMSYLYQLEGEIGMEGNKNRGEEERRQMGREGRKYK